MKKGRNLLRKLSAFLLMAMISVPLLGSDSGASCVQAAGQKEKAAVSEMTVHYLDVGQGDCVLVSCDGESMLIDAGDNNQGTKIQNYLRKQGVTKLKYAVGTHPDADHIGGLDVILYKFDCGTVMMPDVSKNTATYRDVVDTMKQKGYRNTVPEPGDSFKLGDAVCTVLGPEESYEDANNNSIVLKVEHGENSFLFMGDAEAEAEADILSGGADVEADVSSRQPLFVVAEILKGRGSFLCGDQLRRRQQLWPSSCGDAQQSARHGRGRIQKRRTGYDRGSFRRQSDHLEQRAVRELESG